MTSRRPVALLFDMDGTLTQPLLDFPKIKAEMEIGDKPILEAMAALSPEKRAVAEEILLRHERQAAVDSMLNAGCDELMQWVDSQSFRTALITRNSVASVKTVLARHHLRFEVLVTREDGKFKPDPTPLLLACEKLRVDVGDAWMIGDGQYDIEAGNAAGCRTVWISHGGERPFSAEPWCTVRDLPELTALLRRCHSL